VDLLGRGRRFILETSIFRQTQGPRGPTERVAQGA
jgi:hypothetical protein